MAIKFTIQDERLALLSLEPLAPILSSLQHYLCPVEFGLA